MKQENIGPICDQKPSLIFITGASGAGKTTVLKAIESERRLNDISINYFDSIGVPSTEKMIEDYGSVEKWQEATTNNWVEKLSRVNDKRLVFLEGKKKFPEFAMSAVKKCNISNYLIICLHVDKDMREHRLIHLRNQPELANRDMAEFLKKKTIEVGGIVIQSLDIRKTVEEIFRLIKNRP